ncbi:hypothetical protein NAF17_06310 [Mucilaginibacter sp. RB4R14]|uniref:hypothetical protein n=1 Tax=Mucilaginibacter aurantiaciroseus TaxID=2949308 RepID=UPI00209107EE|nr:hypothetical protein [Mucilaginibacter aurantiaciroseus]MCO5935145.1 hypothetical protein [Mucilaginibacter aurantiaciroseus]
MKRLLALLFLSFIIFSCTDTKKQEKDLFNEVIKMHDRVMGKEQLIMINKMQLDTLIRNSTSTEVTAAAKIHSTALDSTDAHMETWMHNFDAENKGKSHDEIMTYLTDQKKLIDAIDNSFNKTLAVTAKFIKQNKTTK